MKFPLVLCLRTREIGLIEFACPDSVNVRFEVTFLHFFHVILLIYFPFAFAHRKHRGRLHRY